jgi:ABC-type lipoprotein release transport system permease subunit
VAIVNQAFAEQLFPNGEDPIGKQLRSWRDENLLREIVGVVGNVRIYGMADSWQPMVYVPASELVAWPRLRKVTLSTGLAEPLQLVAAVRAQVRRLDPKLPVTDLLTMRQIATESVSRERIVTGVLAAFSIVAVILAALGLYGVVSYSVSQRTLEIGIRLALGARSSSVQGMVVRQGAHLAFLGCGIGILAAMVLSRWLSSLLTDIGPLDPVTYLVVTALLLIITAIASLGPARRASKVEPLQALRHE